jgi:hypothetical protein
MSQVNQEQTEGHHKAICADRCGYSMNCFDLKQSNRTLSSLRCRYRLTFAGWFRSSVLLGAKRRQAKSRRPGQSERSLTITRSSDPQLLWALQTPNYSGVISDILTSFRQPHGREWDESVAKIQPDTYFTLRALPI